MNKRKPNVASHCIGDSLNDRIIPAMAVAKIWHRSCLRKWSACNDHPGYPELDDIFSGRKYARFLGQLMPAMYPRPSTIYTTKFCKHAA